MKYFEPSREVDRKKPQGQPQTKTWSEGTESYWLDTWTTGHLVLPSCPAVNRAKQRTWNQNIFLREFSRSWVILLLLLLGPGWGGVDFLRRWMVGGFSKEKMMKVPFKITEWTYFQDRKISETLHLNTTQFPSFHPWKPISHRWHLPGRKIYSAVFVLWPTASESLNWRCRTTVHVHAHSPTHTPLWKTQHRGSYESMVVNVIARKIRAHPGRCAIMLAVCRLDEMQMQWQTHRCILQIWWLGQCVVCECTGSKGQIEPISQCI